MIDPAQATFHLGHAEILPAPDGPVLSRLAARLFAFMWRNTTRATAFYKIPADRVGAIGLQIEF